MGMESYYIMLSVEHLIRNDIIQLFEQKYSVSKYKMPTGKLFKRYIIDDKRFVIDNKAVVDITMMQNTANITFELCFSNYQRNLSYIYDVAKWVSLLGKTTRLKVLNSEYNFNELGFDEFKTIISESFFEKFYQFSKRYGKITADILPHDFYNWTRRTKIN